jgi:hypothetical protein
VRGHEVLESAFWAGSSGIVRDQAGKLAVCAAFIEGSKNRAARTLCLESAPV